MKVIVAGLTALAVFAGASATVASAAPADGYRAYEVKHRYVKKKRYTTTGRKQYWADTLPIGTSAWWRQMDREQRGGRR
jgi:uncharacterized protein YxeA